MNLGSASINTDLSDNFSRILTVKINCILADLLSDLRVYYLFDHKFVLSAPLTFHQQLNTLCESLASVAALNLTKRRWEGKEEVGWIGREKGGCVVMTIMISILASSGLCFEFLFLLLWNQRCLCYFNKNEWPHSTCEVGCFV